MVDPQRAKQGMLHLRIDNDLRAQFNVCAVAKGTTMTAVVNDMIRGYVKRHLKESLKKVQS